MCDKQTDDFIALLYHTKAEREVIPPVRQVTGWLFDLFEFLFPYDRSNRCSINGYHFRKNQIDLENILLSYRDPGNPDIIKTVNLFYASLRELYQKLRLDAAKICANDPAAVSIHEAIVSCPGLYAIAVYRIANRLSQLSIPALPRILREHARGKTRIDIHPDAYIEAPFCISQGTGIVIGASSVIGKNVSIHEGVVLGPSTVSKGRSDIKQHPTIEDNVTIYAQSTILGGCTVIGHNSVIGGSVFLTKSVRPYSHVFNTHKLKIEADRILTPEQIQ